MILSNDEDYVARICRGHSMDWLCHDKNANQHHENQRERLEFHRITPFLRALAKALAPAVCEPLTGLVLRVRPFSRTLKPREELPVSFLRPFFCRLGSSRNVRNAPIIPNRIAGSPRPDDVGRLRERRLKTRLFVMSEFAGKIYYDSPIRIGYL